MSESAWSLPPPPENSSASHDFDAVDCVEDIQDKICMHSRLEQPSPGEAVRCRGVLIAVAALPGLRCAPWTGTGMAKTSGVGDPGLSMPSVEKL